MTARNVANGVRHGQDGQAKGQGHTIEANAHLDAILAREHPSQHRTPTPPKDQPKGANKFGKKLLEKWHSESPVGLNLANPKNAARETLRNDPKVRSVSPALTTDVPRKAASTTLMLPGFEIAGMHVIDRHGAGSTRVRSPVTLRNFQPNLPAGQTPP